MKKLIGILLFSIICFGTSLAYQHKKGDHASKTGCCCKKHHHHPMTAVAFGEVKEGEDYFLVKKPVKDTDKKYTKGSDEAENLTDESIVYVHKKKEEQKV